MIVLDANILIRAVLGRRVRQLIDMYGPKAVRLFAPDVAFVDAEKYLPGLLAKHALRADHAAALAYLRTLVEVVVADVYGPLEDEARRRLRGRDEQDWPVLATALVLRCGIWTEDTDFFGVGVPAWDTSRIEIFFRGNAQPGPRAGT